MHAVRGGLWLGRDLYYADRGEENLSGSARLRRRGSGLRFKSRTTAELRGPARCAGPFSFSAPDCGLFQPALDAIRGAQKRPPKWQTTPTERPDSERWE